MIDPKRRKGLVECSESPTGPQSKIFATSLGKLDVDTLPERGLIGHSEQWMPEMRFQPQEIVPAVFLSGFVPSKNRDQLRLLGITDILLIRCPQEARLVRARHPDDFRYCVLETPNNNHDLVLPNLPIYVRHVKGCVDAGRVVLVQGLTGVCKSTSFMIAYVMAVHGLTYKEAYEYVSFRRHSINLSLELRQQLQEWEPIAISQFWRTGDDSPAESGSSDDVEMDGRTDFAQITAARRRPREAVMPMAV